MAEPPCACWPPVEPWPDPPEPPEPAVDELPEPLDGGGLKLGNPVGGVGGPCCIDGTDWVGCEAVPKPPIEPIPDEAGPDCAPKPPVDGADG